MERLGLWIREVVTILFFITLVEALVPLRVTRGYVRLATGLILITVLLRPVLQVQSVRWDEGWLEGLTPGTPPAVDAGRLEEAQRRQALALYLEAVRAEAHRVTLAVAGVERAVVRVEVEDDPRSPRFGDLRRLRVGVAGTPEAVAAAGPALAAHFQVPPEQIEVEAIR